MSTDAAQSTAQATTEAAPAAPEVAAPSAPAFSSAQGLAGAVGNRAMGQMARGSGHTPSVAATPGFAGAVGNHAMARLARSQHPADRVAEGGGEAGGGRRSSETSKVLAGLRQATIARNSGGTTYVPEAAVQRGLREGKQAKKFPFKMGFDTTGNGAVFDLSPTEDALSKQGLKGSYPKKPLKVDKPLLNLPVFTGVFLALGVKFEAKLEGEMTPKVGLSWLDDTASTSSFALTGMGEGSIKLVAEGGLWAGLIGGVPGVASVSAKINGGIGLEGEGKIGMGPKGRITYDWDREEWLDPVVGLQVNGSLTASAKLQLKGTVDYELIFDNGTIYEWKIAEMPIAEAGAKLDVFCRHDGTAEDKSSVTPPKWGEVADKLKAILKGDPPPAALAAPPAAIDPAALAAEAYKNSLPLDGGGGMTGASGTSEMGTGPNSSQMPEGGQSTTPPDQSSAQPNQSSMEPNQSTMPPNQSSMEPNQSTMPPNQSSMEPNQSTMPPNQSTMPPGHGEQLHTPAGVYDDEEMVCKMAEDTQPIEPKPSF